MLRTFCIAAAALAVAGSLPASAQQRVALDANGNFSSLIARYSAAYTVPESLIRRVIRRESGGNPHTVSRGNYGLMQIKLATARGLGYSGGAAGLLDADTNMRYAVKYLAGAWKLSGGSEARAVHYYASGYYYAAKRRGLPPAGTRYAMLDGGDMGYGGGKVASLMATTIASPASPNFH